MMLGSATQNEIDSLPIQEVIPTKLPEIGNVDNLPCCRYNIKRFRVSLCTSAFLAAIGHIIVLSAKKKMVWPNATTIVALVAYVHGLVKFTISKFVGNPMGHESSSWAVGAVGNDTVSVGVSNASPFPTSIIREFFNFSPKALFERGFSRDFHVWNFHGLNYNMGGNTKCQA